MGKGSIVSRYKCFVCSKPSLSNPLCFVRCICGSESFTMVEMRDFGDAPVIIKSLKAKITKTKAELSIKPKKNKEIPFQPTPINIDNFFISTMGVFTEMERIPDGFTMFFQSKGSQYYCDDKKRFLVRVSDHWGHGIRFCSWHLKGYPKIISWRWQKQFGKHNRIGFIRIDELEINKAYTPRLKKYEPTSRHPIDYPIVKESRERVVEQYRKLGFKID